MTKADSLTFHKLLDRLTKKYDKKDIFLRSNKSLKHPHKEIEYIKQNGDFLVEIMINFMGLQGNTSQLPSHMLDELSRNEDGGSGWTLFFDFFNHYLLWIFFEILHLRNYPRSFKKDFSDPISKILFAILGIKSKEVARQYLPFAPLLLSNSCTKYYVERVLQSNLNLHNKLYIIENLPHQILIPPSQQNRVGSRNNILGKNLILGRKFLSHQSKIGIYIKDIEYYRALEYLPNRVQHHELKTSVLFLTNHQFCIDLYMKVIYHKRMNFVIGGKEVARLGWGLSLGSLKKKYHIIHTKMHE